MTPREQQTTKRVTRHRVDWRPFNRTTLSNNNGKSSSNNTPLTGHTGIWYSPTELGVPHGFPHIYAGQYIATPYSATPAGQSLYNGHIPYPTSNPAVAPSRADNPYSGSSSTGQGGMMPGVTGHSQPQQNGSSGSGSAAPACVYLCNRELWVKFYQHTTEMIITKQGR